MAIMKNIIITILMSVLLITTGGCRKFLNLDPIDDLSGNNYWKTHQDVERFVWGLYHQFKGATMNNLYFPAVGDLRLAPVGMGENQNRTYIIQLKNNDIRRLLDPLVSYYATVSGYGLSKNTSWARFYEIIGMCNILDFEIDRLTDGILTDQEKLQFKAEASFMRNLCYFFIIRQFGDVAYYTDAYHTAPLGRENMLTVLQYCIDDMAKYKDDLPWTYDDPNIVGVRAMRGAAVTLMMHMNMWIAGFSNGEIKKAYYQRVADLGREIMEESDDAYRLLPIEEFNTIFMGKSPESLFEITQDLNYGEQFSNPPFFPNQVLRPPYKFTNGSATGKAFVYYEQAYLRKLYPEGNTDQRQQLWFDPTNMFSGDGQFVFLKFSNFYVTTGQDAVPNDSQIIFRYADPILLRAEALAELNQDDQAQVFLNIVRNRAGLGNSANTGKELKDDIFWERNREFMGEAQFYFDLVRTKKAVDPEYVFWGSSINVEDFEAGAWTWPVSVEAQKNNPFMTLNKYWL